MENEGNEAFRHKETRQAKFEIWGAGARGPALRGEEGGGVWIPQGCFGEALPERRILLGLRALSAWKA